MGRKKSIDPRTVVKEKLIAKNPECYGAFDGSDTVCTEDCAKMEACRRLKGKLNSPIRGLSRKRAIQAFCWECNGGTSHAPDCNDTACPFYVFRKKNEGKPNLWWCQEAGKWNQLSQEARGVVKVIKSIDEAVEVDEEVDEEDVDDVDEDVREEELDEEEEENEDD